MMDSKRWVLRYPHQRLNIYITMHVIMHVRDCSTLYDLEDETLRPDNAVPCCVEGKSLHRGHRLEQVEFRDRYGAAMSVLKARLSRLLKEMAK